MTPGPRRRGMARLDHRCLEADRVELGVREAKALLAENRRAGVKGKPRQRAKAIANRWHDYGPFTPKTATKLRRPSGKRRLQLLRQVRARDGDDCWWCGAELAEEEMVLDHDPPRSKGGRNRAADLRISCEGCDRRNKDRLRRRRRSTIGS